MRVDKSYFICFLILLSIFIGAFSPTFTFISLFACFILSFILSTSNSKSICNCIIILLCFQNFAIGCGAHLIGNTSTSLKYLTQIPFITIAITWLFSVIRSRGKYLDKSFIIYILAIVLSFFIGRGQLDVILISLRNLIVFYMAFYLGRKSLRKKEDIDLFYDFIMKISIIMLLSGIILLIGWYKLYNLIGINEVYIAKGSNPINGYMNARFYTDIFHIDFKRMGSLYYEPVNLAYFYAATFIFSLYYIKNDKENPSYFSIIINGLGLLLCFGKGGYLIVILTMLIVSSFKIIKKMFAKINTKNALKFVVISVVIIGGIFSYLYYTNVGGSVKPHFWGLIKTYDSILAKPIGYGLGTAGNMATLLNKSTSNWLSSGGESGFMVIMYQLGIQGIIAFCFCFVGTSKKIIQSENKFIVACKVLPFVLLVISLLQENAYTPQCITLFMIIVGAANNIKNEEKEEER